MRRPGGCAWWRFGGTDEAVLTLTGRPGTGVTPGSPPVRSGPRPARAPPACFRILGQIEVWNADRQLAIGGRRQLALLALLLIQRGRAVPSYVLSDALWGSARSGSGNRLQMTVARLRRALAPLDDTEEPVLRTVSGGYLLAAEPHRVDAALFEQHVEAGQQALEHHSYADAAELLRDALQIWRGPPLAEVSFEDFAQAEIRRLEELRLAAHESRIDADLQLGRHAQLIAELEALLASHPTRERIGAQLMLALYRSDRQSDALDIYQRVRVALSEELGLQPGPALTDMQADILEQKPSLRTTPDSQHAVVRDGRDGGGPQREGVFAPLPSRLQPHGPRIFVGRRDERAALNDVLADARFERRSAFVTGDPGIGKTRLVAELARDAHRTGTLVLAGRCDEALDLPYQPFVEALEHLIEHAPRRLLDMHIARYGDSLTRLVPALAPQALQRPAKASESERYVLYQAIDGLLEAAGAGAPVLLILDDLHWADVPTLKLLRRMLTSPRRAPLMLLCTCRLRELDQDHPLRELLADLHRNALISRLELGGLPSEDVGALVRAISDDPTEVVDEHLIDAVAANTSGNPFLITEVMRGLVEAGAVDNVGGRWKLSAGADPGGHLPLSLTEALGQRLARLGADVRQCLRTAAVLGEEFEFDLLSEVADVQAPADALAHATDAAVLLDVPGRSSRFRFAHVIMQRYIYNELGSARRTELHGRVLRAMEAHSDERRWPTAELARHSVAAGAAAAGPALRYATLAGDDAMAKLAPDEARRWYGVALELLGDRPGASAEQRCDLLVRRGEAERQAGELAFRGTLLEAAELARQIGHESGLVRAVLANSRGMQSETGVIDEHRIAMLDAALQIVDDRDSIERAWLLAMRAAELMYAPEWDRRCSLTDDALAMARRLDDADTLSEVLNQRFVTLLAPHTLAERTSNAAEAVAVAEHLRDPIVRFYAYHWRGYACLESGDVDTARSWFARERGLADRFRHPTALWLSCADEANLAIIAGQLEDASRLSSEALELGQRSEPDALACFAAQQASVAFEAGQMGQLVPMLERTVQENPGVPGFRATLALALSEESRLAEAATVVEPAASSGFRDLPYDVTWLAVVCIYAHVCSTLGDQDGARTLYGLLEPWHHQIAFPAFGVWGPVTFYLGRLAAAMGEVGLAASHLAEASRAASRAGAPLWQVRVAHHLTRLPDPTS
ncbi:MAG: BTAD domain-containing putative transcriptional regulator [Solirubrobacteraceae bacterium]